MNILADLVRNMTQDGLCLRRYGIRTRLELGEGGLSAENVALGFGGLEFGLGTRENGTVCYWEPVVVDMREINESLIDKESLFLGIKKNHLSGNITSVINEKLNRGISEDCFVATAQDRLEKRIIAAQLLKDKYEAEMSDPRLKNTDTERYLRRYTQEIQKIEDLSDDELRDANFCFSLVLHRYDSFQVCFGAEW